jgi:hypothetical protein
MPETEYHSKELLITVIALPIVWTRFREGRGS